MRNLHIPEEVRACVEQGFAFAISISGGKDSQALLISVVSWLREIGATNHVFAIHADLGEVEWAQSLPHCAALCARLGVELVTVKPSVKGREAGLLDLWKHRRDYLRAAGKDAPFWSSARNRYCTSDGKTRPINAYLRQFARVVSVEGIRWQESKNRATKPRFARRESLATRKREAYTWNAIIDFQDEDVWQVDGQDTASLHAARLCYKSTGEVPAWWNFHPAYAMGNTRVSCAICVLACMSDFRNGIVHHPQLADTLAKMERESGYTIRQGMSIDKIRESLRHTQAQPTLFDEPKPEVL